MTTVTIWLLIVLGDGYRPMVVVERFADHRECHLVMERLSGQPLTCVQATVLRAAP